MPAPFEIASKLASSSRYVKKNIVTARAWSIPYLFYRMARPVLKGAYKTYKLLFPETPWTSQAAISIFDRILHQNMRGFEYGSGNSTIFFASRLQSLVSVEHNEKWFTIVKSKLKKRGLENVEYHLVPPRVAESTGEYSFYKDYQLNKSDFVVRTEYHDYFTLINNYPDATFDFILVDGRARVECCLNAIPKLKSGGIFALDNSDRSRYRPVFKVLRDWKMIHTTTGLFDTTIWFKP